jgi:molybdopterin/thiamine biosynthesis adenylyltransferase
MPAELRITNTHWDALRQHLLFDGAEHAAVLVCGTLGHPARTTLTTRRVVLLGEQDMLRSDQRHLSVSPIALARATKAARRDHSTVVLCHSHPWPGPVHPSPLDLATEADLCGRSLSARLNPRPVGGLVLGPDGFSGRLWTASGATSLDRVRVLGDQVILHPEPPEQSLSSRVTRQTLAWGNLGQTRLAGSHVAVVGVGGTGSQVVQQLAHLGVPRLTVIDPDVVEETNLSRLIGATPADVGRDKVFVAARTATAINPALHVDQLAASVIDVDPVVFDAVDVVVCATDGHGSRALLTELAQQYLVPVVDLGVNIIPTSTKVRAGGQVRVLRPGRGCLHCAETLDSALVREEYLTEVERQKERQRGYLRGVDAPAPAVVALNGVIASLACLEVCQLLAGFLGPGSDRVLYRADQRALTTAGVPVRPDCYVCGPNGLLGLGDGRDLPVRRAVVGSER